MYKPNGEELMSPLEEMAARQKMSKKAKDPDEASPSIDSLRSALYTALYGSRPTDSSSVFASGDRIYARNSR
jgi:hypothetical protein